MAAAAQADFAFGHVLCAAPAEGASVSLVTDPLELVPAARFGLWRAELRGTIQSVGGIPLAVVARPIGSVPLLVPILLASHDSIS
jgi:hypothetical protein